MVNLNVGKSGLKNAKLIFETGSGVKKETKKFPCLAKDEGRPLDIGLQERVSNYLLTAEF